MTLISHKGDMTRQQEITTNLVFQMEVLGNCVDPTNNALTDELEAYDLGGDSWEFTFTLPANFDGTESVFRKFQRYRLDPHVVVDACVKAAGDRAQ
jgi:hypothetical protein